MGNKSQKPNASAIKKMQDELAKQIKESRKGTKARQRQVRQAKNLLKWQRNKQLFEKKSKI